MFQTIFHWDSVSLRLDRSEACTLDLLLINMNCLVLHKLNATALLYPILRYLASLGREHVSYSSSLRALDALFLALQHLGTALAQFTAALAGLYGRRPIVLDNFS